MFSKADFLEEIKQWMVNCWCGLHKVWNLKMASAGIPSHWLCKVFEVSPKKQYIKQAWVLMRNSGCKHSDSLWRSKYQGHLVMVFVESRSKLKTDFNVTLLVTVGWVPSPCKTFQLLRCDWWKQNEWHPWKLRWSFGKSQCSTGKHLQMVDVPASHVSSQKGNDSIDLYRLLLSICLYVLPWFCVHIFSLPGLMQKDLISSIFPWLDHETIIGRCSRWPLRGASFYLHLWVCSFSKSLKKLLHSLQMVVNKLPMCGTYFQLFAHWIFYLSKT